MNPSQNGLILTFACGDRRGYISQSTVTNSRQVHMPLVLGDEHQLFAPATPLAGALVAATLLACGDSATPPEPPDPPVPASISVSPSSATFTYLGETAAFTAAILDQYGAAYAGTVSWSGSDPNVFSIDAAGGVTAVGNGQATVTALFQGLTDTASVTVAQVPAEVSPTSGADQRARAGRTLAEPVRVRVTDAGGSPVEGATVTFTPRDGHGTADPATIASDSAGSATTAWTLGPVAGGQTLTASVAAGPSAEIGATALTPEETAAAVELLEGANQRARVGRALPQPILVRLVDAGGLPVEGATVTFTPGEGHGTAEPATVASDSAGSAHTVWTLGDGIGEQVLVASVGDAVPAEIVATGLPPLPVVSIEEASASGREGDVVTLHVMVVREGPAPDSAIVVTYAVGADSDPESADADDWDHDLGTGGGLPVPGGATSVELQVAINDDEEIESPRETFTVAVLPSPDDAYEVGTSATVVVTIEEGVCDRTPRVRAEIMAQVESIDCTSPTAFDLGRVTQLNLAGPRPEQSPTEFGVPDMPRFEPGRKGVLSAGDQHVVSIDVLQRADFTNLANLLILNLQGNELSSLPDGVFAGLSQLSWLGMGGNRLSSLPDGVFAGLSQLSWLGMGGNRLSSLPDGVFAGLSQLSYLDLRWNPGAPFPLDVGVTRIDAEDPLAPGPATVVANVEAGAPFPMAVRLRAEGGLLSDSVVEVQTGGTASGGLTVTPAGSGSRFVEIVATPSLPDTAYYGLEIHTNAPLVLANPPDVRLDLPVVYLVQAAQNHRGTVRLVAGRQALLRVFGTSDLPTSYKPWAVATFYLGGEQVHEVRMNPPKVLPTQVEERRMDHSYSATIPGSVIQPGLNIVVELDPEGVVPQGAGSTSRFPATERHRVWVSRLPPLEMTLVPVHFASDPNRAHNSKVTEFAQDLAHHDETGLMWYVRNILPIGELRIRVREPYVTRSDQADNGVFDMVGEIAMLRFLEADGTDEYYHGLWAHPSVVSNQEYWFFSAAQLSGYTAVTNVFDSDGEGPFGHITFAHELGHNLSLPHAPCGGPSGVDPAFPYSDGSIGTFGYSYQRDPMPRLSFVDDVPIGIVSPTAYKEVMSYCWPNWISDYNFKKAMSHRLERARTAPGVVTSALGEPRKMLLLWGGVRDGSLRMEPAFAMEAPLKLPARPGPYRLTGMAESGATIFQIDFSPDPIDHGGASFLFALPFQEEWTDALDRIELSGPEGTTSVDQGAGGRAAILVDESTGRVRSIVRDWPERGAGAVRLGDGGVVVRRGLPRR